MADLFKPRTRDEHFDPGVAPKRILALDGGGIRGILTLQFLDAIEGILRKKSGNPNYLLSDYFDLIGGTSTGSIIAAGLACGMQVGELKTLYRELGGRIFKKSLARGVLVPKFGDKAVRAALVAQLGEKTTLGSTKIRTGLMVMTKRLDTGSPWPLHNGPGAKFQKQDGALRLVDIVRASTAAPAYFAPEAIPIASRTGKVVTGAFVDGGVSPFNDPALQLLMLAALQGHGYNWATGSDKLRIISVGTGSYRKRYDAAKLTRMVAAKQGITALLSLMDDCGRMNLAMMQWLTETMTTQCWDIDRAHGDMLPDSRNGPKLASFARYNVLLDAEWLLDNLKLKYSDQELERFAQMDAPGNMDVLEDLGREAAKRQVLPRHFDR